MFNMGKIMKITKEQAEWLIEKIKLIKTGELFDPNPVTQLASIKTISAIERMINQCIEKEFPYFKLAVGCQKINIKDLRIEESFCSNCAVRIHNNEDEPAYHFTFEQFKAFTKGCISICQWLDEQE